MYKLLIKATSTLTFAFSSAFAATNPAQNLTKLLNNFHSLQANFEQSSTNSKGKLLGKKTIGKIALERPGKFRWETSQPNNQLLIINGNQSSLYDADLEQVVNKKIDPSQSSNPATLLSNSTVELTKFFVIKKINSSDKNLWFQLTPKNKNNTYTWIKIGFVHNKLKTMQIFSNLGQTTTINLDKVIFNPTLPKNIFVFIPPPNTEVFNQRN